MKLCQYVIIFNATSLVIRPVIVRKLGLGAANSTMQYSMLNLFGKL